MLTHKKKVHIFSMIILLIFSILFFLPKVFNLTKYNDIISEQIEEKTGLYIKAKGNTNFSIIPKVRVQLKDITINISDPEEENSLLSLGNGEGLFFEISLINLLKGNFSSIDKIVLSKANLDFTNFEGNKEYVKDLIGEKIDTQKIDALVYLEKSNVIVNINDEQRNLEDVSAKINYLNRKVLVSGDGIYKNLKFNLDSKILLKDVYNISGETSLFYKSKGLDYGLNFRFNKDFSGVNLKGDLYFKKFKNKIFEGVFSDDLLLRLSTLNAKEKSKFSGGFQYSNGNFRIEKLKLDTGGNNGIINYYYNKSIKKHSISLDMKNLYITSGVEKTKDFLIDFLNKYRNIYIDSKVRFLHLGKEEGIINDLSLKLNNKNEIKIKDLTFKSSQFKKFSFNGILKKDLIIGEVNLSPGYNWNNDFLRRLDFKSLKGTFEYDFKDISLYNTIFVFGSDIAKGDILIKDNIIDINFSSENLSLNNSCKNGLVECLSENLSISGDFNNISMRGKVKRLKYKEEFYNDIFIDLSLVGKELNLKKLLFADQYNSVYVDGSISGFRMGEKKRFNNLYFETKTTDFEKYRLYNLSIPFLKDVLKNKSGKIMMNIDGPMSNPKVGIRGEGEGLSFDLETIVSGRGNPNIDMSFNIDNFKEFLKNYNLKSSALRNINSNLVKDDVSVDMSVSLDSKTGYLSYIGIKKDGSSLDVEISFDNERPILKISSENLKLDDFIKRSSKSYKSDILVYSLNSFGGNLDVDLKNILDYEDAYKDFSIERNISNSSLKMSYVKNDSSSFSISGIYDGIAGFDGELSLQSELEGRFLNTDSLDIENSVIDLSGRVKFFGKKYDEIIANLSSNFNLKISQGSFIGLSSKENLQQFLSSEERMTYSLLEGFLMDLSIQGRADIQSILISGSVIDGELKDCFLKGDLRDIYLEGELLGDLKAKMIGFKGLYKIDKFYDEYSIDGNLTMSGFLKGEIEKDLEVNTNVKNIPILRIKNFYK